MATIDDVKTAYKAFYGTDISGSTATATAAQIDSGALTLDSYISSLNSATTTTTGELVATYAYLTGKTPTAATISSLITFAQQQQASYQSSGANATIGAAEAVAVALARDTTTKTALQTKIGTGTDSDFIDANYISIFNQTPSTGAKANFLSQISYFTGIYTKAGIAAVDATLQARAAVIGQMAGYAMTDPAFKATATIDDQATAFLTGAAKGSTSGYGAALPTVTNPGQTGVSITITTAADTVGTGVADPALKTTAFNDTITAPAAIGFAAQKIDGGAGEDTANLNVIAAAVVLATGQVNSVETVNFTASAAATTIDLGTNSNAIVGVKTVGNVDSTVAFAVNGLASGVNLSVVDTTPTTASSNATFALKDATGTTDTANVSMNGFNGGATLTLTGFENVNVTTTGNNSTAGGGINITDADLKVLSVAGTKDLTAALGAPAGLTTISSTASGTITLTGVGNAVTSIDGSTASGGLVIADVGDAAITIKGGSGNDTFADITKSGAVVTAGAGNDTIGFNLAAASTATVNGGAGGDSITLTGGKVTVVYSAASDSLAANPDVLTAFTTGSDKIDLKALALTGNITSLNTFSSAVALADGTDYFSGKAVAYGQIAAGNWYVIVDANNNGKFDVNSDLIVQIAGGAAGSVVFGDLVLS